MSSNKKQTTLGYVKSQTTLGRFFNLSPSNPAIPIQSTLKTIRAAQKKPTARGNDGSDSDKGYTEPGASSEMGMSGASELAIHPNKGEKTREKPSTKRARPMKSNDVRKHGDASPIIKKEAGVSEDEAPPTKRSRQAKTTGSPKESRDDVEPSDEDIAPTNPPKKTAKKGKGKASGKATDVNIPASPFETAKGVRSSSIPPPVVWHSASEESDLSLPQAPPSKSKRYKSGSKAETNQKSPPGKKPKKRIVSSDSEAADEPESYKFKAGTAKKSLPDQRSKKRVVTSDSEAADKPETIKSEAGTAKKLPPVKESKKRITASDSEAGDKPERPNSKAGAAKKSPLVRRSKKRIVASDSETGDKPERSNFNAGVPEKSSPLKGSKERIVASDSEAADKPENSVTRRTVGSDSETEKPSLAPAAGREMIKKLSKAVAPAYPDWVAGGSTPYAALVTTFNLLESTTKRLEKISHTSRFLRQVLRLSPDELLLVIHLMTNKLAADFEGVEMGIGESLLMKAIGESCGRSLEGIREDQRECGDLGLVAMKSRNTQRTLFAPQPLSIAVVHKGLLDIAKVKGEGGQGRKVSAIRKLLAAAKGDEAKFLIRGLEGKLRLGLADRTVLVSLSSAMITHEQELSGKMPTTAMLDQSELNLRSVYSELPSYEIIIPAIREHGIMNIKKHCKLQPGVPVKPMLAKPTKAISEVLDRFENQRFTCEYKYDGERAQIHYVSPQSSIQYPPATLGGKPIQDIAKVFSRNSEDLSGKYPDILAAMNNWVRPGVESFVLDCEAVGWDETNNRLLPFQMLQTRKKKDVALEDVKIRVCVHAFDLLFLNGKPVVRESLSNRRKLMHETFIEVPNQFVFARYMDSSDLEEIRLFLDQSVKDSCEGLMVKIMDGPESFYEPSQRSCNWLKIKKDYIDKLGDSLDLVVIGAYWGKGKRTSVYGSFLLACYNPGTQNYESVCNIGTGFSEAELEEFYETLHPLEIDRAKPFYDHPSGNAGKPDVWFEPKILWEVKAADLTLSPRYKAAAGLAGHKDKGVSLRFPRFIGARTDKTGENATSSSQVAEMYLRQDQVAHKTGAKGVDDDFEY